MARPEIKSKDMILLLALETALGSGSGASITLPAAVSGAVPVGPATVTTAGTGYPASDTIYVLYTIGGNSTALGTITTNASGIITAATVLDGGAGYVHATPTAATIKAAPNSAYGRGVTGISASDAILFGSDMTIKLNKKEIKRDVVRGIYIGATESVVGDTWLEISFSIELAGSGTAATPTQWSKLLRMAGFSEAITAGTKCDYTPVSDDFPSGAGALFYGGVRHSFKGARVMSVDISAPVADVATAKITMQAIDTGQFPANANTPTFATWMAPVPITDANAGDIQFGCTYASGSGAISGGSAFPSTGLSLKIENTGGYRPLLGGGSGVYISERKITGEITIDQMPQERRQSFIDWRANTATAVGFSIGSVAGSRLRFFGPNRVITDITPTDVDGKLMSKINFELRPTAGVGNDELRIVTL